MMFSSPDYIEASILCHLYHLKRMAGNFIHSETVVQTLKIYSQLKFHISFLFLSLLQPSHPAID
jgi:hypothetical protein